MGTCKECGKVYSVLEMKDGVCKNCRGDEDTDQTDHKSNIAIEATAKANEVAIVDIKVPFWSMVVLMVKWVLASIPAFIILFVIFFALFSVAYSAFIPQQNPYQQYRGY